MPIFASVSRNKAKTMKLDKLKVSAPSVLRMIPDELLSKLARDTKVDYCAKVLKGERLFYLLVYAFLCADRLSQRKLEDWIIDLNVAIKTSGPEYKKAMQAVRNRIP